MKIAHWLPLTALCLSSVAACSGGGGGDDPTPQCQGHLECGAGQFCPAGSCVALPAGECRKDADCAAGQGCVADVCQAVVVAECDKAANVARKAELVAAQPALVVKASSGKTVRTFTKTFASVGGDASVECAVDLQYKDLNGDGAVQPYEDWTRTADERAADLAGRMSAAQKLALMAHAVLADSPTPTSAGLSTATQAVVDAGLRFGLTAASTAQLTPRATWANALQERCEASALGVPFVLSMEPAHSSGNGRVRARGFSQWPSEAGLGATGDAALVERFGQYVSQEYRAIGVRMALSPSANLATDPRWPGAPLSFGEDSAAVAELVGAYVKGLQGETLGRTSVAAVAGQFPGAGAAKGGLDARLAKGRFTSYPGNRFDQHAGAFQRAFDRGVAGVMPGYGVPEAGAWTGLGGLVNGATVEQVGASFNATLLTDVLRGHYGFGGLVIAPAGVLEDAGVAPLGAPWGMESATKAQRVAKAVGAGVDQLIGLNDTVALAAAGLEPARVDAAAARALALVFRLGLFEDPYVNAAQAPALCNTDLAYQTGLDAMNRGTVLLVNDDKPAGWLDGAGDGTQTGDKGNAGNGSLKVLPAPPGEPYVSAGCDYFVLGDFDLDYVRSVSAGYGNLTNDAPNVKGVPVSTAAERMALSDYVFVRIAAPYTADPDGGALGLPLASLEYAGNDPAVLAPVAAARAAIDAWTGAPASQAQIVVGVDAGRPSVVSELLAPAYGVAGLYYQWGGTLPANPYADKVFLDVAFGIVNGRGKLPVGLPLSDAAATAQQEDAAGDGQDPTLLRGAGIDTNRF
jgi:beta-glucosidase-like glycosyl hydrolase